MKAQKIRVEVTTHARGGERVTASACLFDSRAKRRARCVWEVADTAREAARKAVTSLKKRVASRRSKPFRFVVRVEPKR